MELNYSNYLHLEQLLELQRPRSHPEEHDELLFIVAHQAYELWFKLLLHEFDKIKRDFLEDQLFNAIATFKRTRTVMKVMVAQIDILETLTPVSFESFRDRLETASGFQSVQFREMEFVLGYKRPEMLRYHKEGTAEYTRLLRRLHEASVVDCFYVFLEGRGVTVPPQVKEREPTGAAEGDQTIEAGVLRLYRTHPEIEILVELMTDFDEGFQEWRYRHIKLVERTIGSKAGTGGSLGVEFLKKSLFRPIFAELWGIRHQL